MKTLKHICFIILGILLLASCAPHYRTHGNHRVPPGQAKKITGEKSAKHHAPGQVKKRTGAKSAKHYAPGQVKKNHKNSKRHY